MSSGWVGVDLDGTLAEHYWPDDGPYDPYRIGAPIPAMVALVQAIIDDGNEVRIFTARVGPHGPGWVQDDERVRQAIRDWTAQYVGVALEATATKDYEMRAAFDDRAFGVIANTGELCCHRRSATFKAAALATPRKKLPGLP